MDFRIVFNDLPFTPDKKQVIYVENLYDEKVNLFIRNNYDALVAGFKKYGLEFVYLPLYFKANDVEAKVRYYAPYLVSQINEPDSLRSSYLLNYLMHPENRSDFSPSLLFAPEQEIWGWKFQGFSLDDMIGRGAGVVDVVEQTNKEILRIKAEIEGEVRFRISPSDDNDSERARFRKVPAEEENKVKESRTLFRKVEESPEESLNRARREEEKLKKKHRSWWRRVMFCDWVESVCEDPCDEEDDASRIRETREMFFKGEIEIKEILADLQANVEKLRLMGVALGAIHEFIDKHEPLSQLVITEDLRLLLPLYNVEIELSAQKKALYFLFLNHPEGIVLQRLEDYHNELVNYYKQTNKGVLTQKMEESIKKLETYGNNQLNVLIARIREAFCLKFDERLARNYFISGEKGQPYKIPLDQELIKWEE